MNEQQDTRDLNWKVDASTGSSDASHCRTAVVATDSVRGRIHAKVIGQEPFRTGLSGTSPQAHQQAADEALKRAGIVEPADLASAWREPGKSALHLADLAPRKFGRHELPAPGVRMAHSHIVRGSVVGGSIHCQGLDSRLLSELTEPLEKAFHDAAFRLVQSSGLPIADLRTHLVGQVGFSVFTTTPASSGQPRRVEPLETRIARAYGRADAAVTDADQAHYLRIARALEEHKSREEEAEMFLSSVRRAHA